MLFSVNYQSARKQEAGEVRCPINQLGLLTTFIHDNPAKRINIIAQDKQDFTDIEMRQIELIKNMTENYAVECGKAAQMLLLISHGYHAYLKYPVTDWETFTMLTEIGVSDIYIDGPLCFQMDKLSKCNVKIRVSPTLSPNTSLAAGKPNNFFIRPEDLSLYSAIDVIDFKESNQEKEDALFDIYKRGTFNYSLKDLITNFPYDINNLLFKEDFAQHRLNCGQKCKQPGRSCHLCSNYFNLLQSSLKLIEKSN